MGKTGLACDEDYATPAALFFKTIEEHHPRLDKRTWRWTCDCDDWFQTGDIYPCKHIEAAKRIFQASTPGAKV